jgi:hypothetical protein
MFGSWHRTHMNGVMPFSWEWVSYYRVQSYFLSFTLTSLPFHFLLSNLWHSLKPLPEEHLSLQNHEPKENFFLYKLLSLRYSARAGRVAQVVECLPSKFKALSSANSTAKKKNKQNKRKKEEKSPTLKYSAIPTGNRLSHISRWQRQKIQWMCLFPWVCIFYVFKIIIKEGRKITKQ